MYSARPEKPFFTSVVLLLIVATGFAFRAIIACADINYLLGHGYLQDDAYYYFVIARNIAENGLVSFDGETLTNGFHPLWQLLITPFWFFLEPEHDAVLASMWLAVVLNTAAIPLLFFIVRRITAQTGVALFAAALFAFHGSIIGDHFNGLETSLNSTVLLLLLWQFLRLVLPQEQDEKSSGLSGWFCFGFFASLVFLARTDNAFVIITLYSALLFFSFREERLSAFLLAGMTGVVFILPWLWWNYHHFGAIVQSSGLAGGIYWYQDWRETNSFWQNAGIGGMEALRQIDIVSRSYLLNLGHNLGFWIGLVFIVFSVLLFIPLKKHNPVLYRNARWLVPFIVGLLLTFSYHTLVRAFVRIWYEAPLSLAFVLVLSVCLCLIGESLHKRFAGRLPRAVPAVLVLLLLLAAHPPLFGLKNKGEIRDYDRLLAAEWINSNLPETAVLGAGNAGIQAYYSHRKLVNLDGVVNIDAHHARVERRFNQYLFNSGIGYIIENEGGLAHYCNENTFYRCTEVMAFGESKRPVKIARVTPIGIAD